MRSGAGCAGHRAAQAGVFGRALAAALLLLLSLGAPLGATDSQPTIPAQTPPAGTVNVPYSYPVLATGGDLTYSAANLPPGLSINGSTGVVSGTPQAAMLVNASITVRNDVGSATAQIPFLINPPTPVVTSGTASGQVGTAFDYQILATNDPTQYGASGLPTGLSVNTSSGAITGTPTQAGSFSVTISATNATGTGTGTLSLTITPATPVITSPLTLSLGNGATCSYTITATNAPTAFYATGLPTGLSVNNATGAITGASTATGTYAVTISATNAGGTGSATLTLTILPPLPVITSSTTPSGQESVAFTYQITATNSPTSYGATGLPSFLTLTPSTGAITGTPYQVGTFTFSVSATNAGGTGTASVTLTVTPPTPVITSALSVTTTVNQAFSYQITASNAPTSYGATGLPTGLSVNTSTGVISGTPTATGTSSVTISATNAGGTGSAILSLTVVPPVPVITSASHASGTVGQGFSYTITATNNPTAYGATGLPAGLSVASTTGVISGTPTAAGTFTPTISATNAGGTGTLTLTLTIAQAIPTITSSLTATGTQGSAFAYQITATGSPTSYGASGLPSGLSVNSATGAITGTPTATGTTAVTLSATNAAGTGSATLELTVTPPAPVITSPLTASGTTGSEFSYQIQATNSPTSYAATSLPAGLVVNTTSGLISGTPTTAGTSVITVSATNAGGTGSAAVTVTIAASVPPPVITSALSASGTQGTPFSYQITATNSPTSFGASGLPAGLSIATATGLITGTPAAAGTTQVTITATNHAGTGSAALTLAIAPAAPVITSALSASGAVDVAFTYQIQATNSPTSYAATNLPAGLVVNTSSGAITGTPSATGTTVATISATNAGGTGSASLTITIGATLAPPVITSPGTATAQVGTAFLYQITATNSPTSFNATGLPAGLQLNASSGAISGTPTGAGTATITLSATNVSGTGTATLELTILPATPVITSATSASGHAGAPFTYQITASGDPTTWGATSLPTGLVVNTSTGAITGTPTTPGTTIMTVSAANAGGTGTAQVTVTILAPLVPVITSPLAASATVGLPFSYQITASNAPTSFGASSLPSGLIVNTSTGAITGTLTAALSQTITVSAANSAGIGTASVTLTATVPPPPVITSTLSLTAFVGTAFSYQITGTNTPTAFSATGLPQGLSLAPDSGMITGTLSTPGVNDFTVSAANAGGSTSQPVVLTVYPAGGQDLGWSSGCGVGSAAATLVCLALARRRRGRGWA